MRSFDPDVPDELDGDVEFSAPGRVVVTAENELELLSAITADLPGGGESRPGQQEMVRAVTSAIATGEHLIIEAGTGVGKSLGYLVPSALSGSRVVIATATKNLQDQLGHKDAPAVIARTHASVAVLKGRQNYLCRLKARGVGDGNQMSFETDDLPKGYVDEVRRILAWGESSEVGDRDELPFEVDPRSWRAVSVTPQECLGRMSCPVAHECFTEKARDRAAEADIVIVNTHLYASHLASGQTLLPAHEVVILDEAHEALDIFTSALGTSLALVQLRAIATTLRPHLRETHPDALGDLVSAIDRLSSALERQLDERQDVGLSESAMVAVADASRALAPLIEALRVHPRLTETERQNAVGPAVHILGDLDRLTKVSERELLHVEREGREPVIKVSLIDVGPRLAGELWDHVTAVCTSATIPLSLRRDLGLPASTTELQVPSPFDYPENGLLYVPEMADRNDPVAEQQIIDHLVELITWAEGRTLALFTNTAVMRRVHEAVKSRVATPVLVQGEKARGRLLTQFAHDESTSLFAVASFWQGVDVPGKSLSVVAIDRLPFRPQGDPISEARRSRSTSPFMEVDLPRATMMLAQGIGRLIRSSTDRGVVAVFDIRLAEARYGNVMRKRIPPMRRTRVGSDVREFLEAILED